MFSWGDYICAADICAWGYFMYFDKVSCFSLALGLDQMIWSWVVFVSLTKFMKQEHGRNEEKSEKAWNKIMAIMSQSYLAMKIVQACILSLKAQWGHPSKYHWFLVFLVSTQSLLNHFGFFDVMLHTCPAQFNRSIRNRFWQCWGWSNHSWCRGSTATTTTTNTTTTTTTTTSSSAKLTPWPARHELTHLRTLILGEVGLATMQDHGRAQWLWLLSWHDSNHLSDRHHLVFLHHSKLAGFPGFCPQPKPTQ